MEGADRDTSIALEGKASLSSPYNDVQVFEAHNDVIEDFGSS